MIITADTPLGTLREDQGEVVTRTSLVAGLEALGLQPGDCVLVHTAMSRLGYVIGGPQTVVDALTYIVGKDGCVMMPTFSGDLSDPAEWRHPPIPADWIGDARTEMPGYNPKTTPTSRVGAVPEYFRSLDGVVRSDHPHSSFAARGANAHNLARRHPAAFRFGEESPLQRLLDRAGKVLLLGAPHDTASFIYLVQHKLGIGAEITKRSPVRYTTYSDTLGRVHWLEYKDREVRADLVAPCVDHLIECGIATTGQTGLATSVLFPCREALAELTKARIGC